MVLVKDVGHFSVGRTIHQFIWSFKHENKENLVCLPVTNRRKLCWQIREKKIPRFAMCSAPSLHQKVMKLDETTQEQEMEEGCEIM